VKPINLAAAIGARRTSRPANRAQPKHRDGWYRIANSTDGTTATVSIYDEIGYWGTTASQFCDELAALDVTQIDVRINSPGGDVFDGCAIYNALLNHPADVTTHNDGLAASIASLIFQAGDVRVVARASQMMIHKPSALCIGCDDDMVACAALLGSVGTMIASVYADAAGGGAPMWLAAMGNETWYSAEEAVTAGLADAVQGQAVVEDAFDLTIFNYAGRSSAPAPPVLNWDPDAFRRAVKEAVL
jgi:ATP-dependent protease ClpP protease subunit